jgi:hypothetical protein
VGCFLWRENGSVVFNCSWPSPAQSFSGPSPLRLVAIFYCLRFETSLFVASYDSQGYGGGIRPRLHMGGCRIKKSKLTAARLVSSLYKPRPDPTENTASNNPIFVMGGSLTMLFGNVCLFICLLHNNSCTHLFRGLCSATGLSARLSNVSFPIWQTDRFLNFLLLIITHYD